MPQQMPVAYPQNYAPQPAQYGMPNQGYVPQPNTMPNGIPVPPPNMGSGEKTWIKNNTPKILSFRDSIIVDPDTGQRTKAPGIMVTNIKDYVRKADLTEDQLNSMDLRVYYEKGYITDVTEAEARYGLSIIDAQKAQERNDLRRKRQDARRHRRQYGDVDYRNAGIIDYDDYDDYDDDYNDYGRSRHPNDIDMDGELRQIENREMHLQANGIKALGGAAAAPSKGIQDFFREAHSDNETLESTQTDDLMGMF